MKKILLVDDEFLARLGLRSLLNWNGHGYEIIGEAENGQEALSLARLHQPDIIISDIQMPLMNGIELINSAKKDGLKSKFVMLSSYDDFSLVKGALKAGAEDYLLKLEMEPDELLSILNTVSAKIEKTQRDEQTEQERIASEKQSRLKLGKAMLKSVLDGKVYVQESLTRLFEDLDICLHSHRHVITVFRLFDFPSLSVEAIKVWKQYLENKAQSVPGMTIIEGNEPDFICIYSFNDQLPISTYETTLSDFHHAAILTAKQSFNIEICAGGSKAHTGVEALRQSFLEAMHTVALTEKLRFNKYKENQISSSQTPVSQLDLYISSIASHMRENDSESILRSFEELVDYLKSHQPLTPLALQGGSHTLHYLVRDFVKQCGIEDTAEWSDIESSWTARDPIENAEEYIDWITQLKSVFSTAPQSHLEKNFIILKAKRYVTTNISTTITLKAISGHLGLSPSYFSRLFHQKAQQCFVDYVREQKMYAAQDLIRTTNKKMYQIANLVGYENVQYFSRVFKQTTGVTPIAFRNGDSK